MNRFHLALVAGIVAGATGSLCTNARAHGFVDDRFFPPTIATDDPFAVDELSFSTTFITAPGDDGGPKTEQLSGGFEFDKEIFPHFAVGIEGNYFRNHPAGENNVYGWDNFVIGLKYELWQSDAHEAIISVGLDTDLGGSGTHTIGESTTTFTPTLYFGKGFGDLPDGVNALQPFAVTGTLGQTFATSAEAPNAFEWGFAVEYSLPYLQSHVVDLGLPQPLKNIIPVCEFSFQTTENRGPAMTTGTINPGLFYESKLFQIGAEAVIPVNHETGNHVGVTLQFELYIDDLFPAVFGHPVFGER